MNRKSNYKIAFVGWNPFQLIHIEKLASNIPGSVFVIEKKKNNNIEEFTEDMFINPKVPLLVWEQKDMIKLDGLFDLIVAQTLFTHVHMFKKTPIIFFQYGYAKEAHNFGTWRALGSLTLTFGEYATKKVSAFTPAVSVGNPRYDVWHENAFHEQARKKYAFLLNPKKKTILYMPTWGELSSVDLYFKSILRLSKKYNLLIKLHHNTDILEKSRIDKKDYKDVYYFGATDDALSLMSVTDIVLSDYSGAIFDAIYCEKPLVLLDLPSSKLENITKIDGYSIEIAERDSLGVRISSGDEIENAIVNTIRSNKKIISNQIQIKKKLFNLTRNATHNAIEIIDTFMLGEYEPNQMQSYMKETMHDYYTKKRELVILKKKIKK